MARDYPQKVVSEQIYRVVFGKHSSPKDISEQGMPFVVIYHLDLTDSGKSISKTYNYSYIVIVRLEEFFHLFL